MPAETCTVAELGLIAASSVILTIALVRAFRALRGTTLVAACGWAFIALTAVVSAEIVGAFGNVSQTSLNALRYMAAVTTLAPAVAVLGAKRPQHRAWQWIVLTLVIVLALPAGETLTFHPGAALRPHIARIAFILVLIFVGVGNYAPTRNALPALLVALGQFCLFAPFMPWFPAIEYANAQCMGITLLAVAGVSQMAIGTAACRVLGWDRAWLDFRDAYGVVWSLRVAERFNQASITHDSSLRLTWRGIADTSHDEKLSYSITSEHDRASQRRLRAMLLRFVSTEWIARRIGHI